MICALNDAAARLNFADLRQFFWKWDGEKFVLQKSALRSCCEGSSLCFSESAQGSARCPLHQTEKKLQGFAAGLTAIWGRQAVEEFLERPNEGVLKEQPKIGYFMEAATQPSPLWSWWFADCFRESPFMKVFPWSMISRFRYEGDAHVALVGFEKNTDYNAVFASI